MGLEHFNILIIQEVIYDSLSPDNQQLFTEIDLKSETFTQANFQLLYDNEARSVYYHILA